MLALKSIALLGAGFMDVCVRGAGKAREHLPPVGRWEGPTAPQAVSVENLKEQRYGDVKHPALYCRNGSCLGVRGTPLDNAVVARSAGRHSRPLWECVGSVDAMEQSFFVA